MNIRPLELELSSPKGSGTAPCPCAGKLPFSQAPPNEDHLPELHLALYNNVIVFDQATKLAYCVAWVHMDRHAGVSEAYLAGKRALDTMSGRLSPARTPSLPLGKVALLSP